MREKLGSNHRTTPSQPPRAESAGQPLDLEQRAFLEPLFAHDFSRVRVFADDHATADLNALAFSSGNDIVMNSRLDPRSAFGREVLAHELAHTVQHDRFGPATSSLEPLSAPGDASEREAHGAARNVLSGQPASIQTAPTASVSRWPEFLGEAWEGAKDFAGGIGTVVDAVKHDGLDTFDDFSGSVKRQQARDELAPGFEGSQWELEKVARAVADVKLGRSDSSFGLDKDATPEERQIRREQALKGLQEEGASSADDIGAVVDRQRAQGELMQGRTIVDDDFAGPRSEGQINQTELRELARIYSGVRRGQLDANLGTASNATPEDRDLRREQALEGLREEGLEGADDLGGMMDRQAAQNELLDKFDIVPDGFTGPRAPNAVTLEEFQQVSRMFSDVRLGRGDLKVDGSDLRDPAKRDQMGMDEAMFKQGAMNDLAAMLQTQVGRQEIELLQNNVVDGSTLHHTSTIKPDFDHRPRGESGDDWREGYGTPEHPGAGTDFVTRYTPGEALDHPGTSNPWYPIRSDVILFHELRHGVDQTRGQLNPGQVTTEDAKVFEKNDDGTINRERFSWDHDILLDRGDNDLEHEAIGVGNHADKPMTENQYRNERNAIGQLDPDSSLPGDGTMKERHRHTWIQNDRQEAAAVAEAVRLEQRTRHQRR
jgi:hypothetical protein